MLNFLGFCFACGIVAVGVSVIFKTLTNESKESKIEELESRIEDLESSKDELVTDDSMD